MRKILLLLGSTPAQAQTRAEWFVASCPLAPWTHDKGTDANPAFAMKREPGDPFTNCFACGWHGTLKDLVFDIRHRNKLRPHLDVSWVKVYELIEKAEEDLGIHLDAPDIEDLLFSAVAEHHVFPDWWLESFPPWSEIGFAREYLEERDVPASVANWLDLRADTTQKRVCFPVRDFKGRLLGLHGRAIHAGVDPRYRMYLQAGKNNPLIWLGETWVDFDQPVVVVEGPFDVASVLRVYPNVVSPLFANPSEEKLLRMGDAFEIITLMDRGMGGDAGRNKIAKTFKKGHIVRHAMLPEGVKDPGAASIEILCETLAPFVDLQL